MSELFLHSQPDSFCRLVALFRFIRRFSKNFSSEVTAILEAFFVCLQSFVYQLVVDLFVRCFAIEDIYILEANSDLALVKVVCVERSINAHNLYLYWTFTLAESCFIYRLSHSDAWHTERFFG